MALAKHPTAKRQMDWKLQVYHTSKKSPNLFSPRSERNERFIHYFPSKNAIPKIKKSPGITPSFSLPTRQNRAYLAFNMLSYPCTTALAAVSQVPRNRGYRSQGDPITSDKIRAQRFTSRGITLPPELFSTISPI